MCGIAGQFGAHTRDFRERALQGLGHRGPDASGVWSGDQAELIHTRLAIMDLSEAGAQPMTLSPRQRGGISSGPWHFVFNGEIYNGAELRAGLEACGEVFTGHSDTEVLLRLLVLEGAACLPKLAGMFAFALWDESTGEGLLARDPHGIKPLYYREDGNRMSFASESRILLEPGDLPDGPAVRDYLLWGSVPEPMTLHQEVRQLPAGHLMHWKNSGMTIRRWTTAKSTGPEAAGNGQSTGESETAMAARLTRAALEESIRRHMVSDVPVGIFLSGGIDSTAVLALARAVMGPGADLRTFSIGFDDPEFDEGPQARRTAEHFGAQHTEWRMTAAEGAGEIEAFLACVDQPSIDGFNTWCVSKLARSHGMKVVLSGLGGDEFFAGYSSFRNVPAFQKLHRRLGALKGPAAWALDRAGAGSRWRRLAAFFRAPNSAVAAFHAQRGIFTEREARDLANVLTGRDPGATDWSDPAELPGDSLSATGWLEVSRYMRHQLLRDSDVFSMAHGLELRVPLVDVRLEQVLLSLPPALRLRQGKQLLLDAVPEIPRWVREQPKRGFRFPFQQWMEGNFGDSLAGARSMSPVPLNTWYRTWAVAAAMRKLAKPAA